MYIYRGANITENYFGILYTPPAHILYNTRVKKLSINRLIDLFIYLLVHLSLYLFTRW